MMRDGQLFRVIDENCWSPEARIRDMDETGKCSYCLEAHPTGLNRMVALTPPPSSLLRGDGTGPLHSACDVQLLGEGLDQKCML